MALVKIKCVNQAIIITNRPIIASGGLQENTMQFEFCDAWEGMTKTAVFYRNENEVYNVLIDHNNECPIPDEVLQEAGTFFFGVYGVIGTKRKTSEIERYNVIQGSLRSEIDEPTPDIYSQLMANYSELKEDYVDVKEEYINIFENLESVVANMSARGFVNLNTNEGVVSLWVGTREEYDALKGNYIEGVKYFVENEGLVIEEINGVKIEQIFEHSTITDEDGNETTEMTSIVKHSKYADETTISDKSRKMLLDDIVINYKSFGLHNNIFSQEVWVAQTKYRKGLLTIELLSNDETYNTNATLTLFFDEAKALPYFYNIGGLVYKFSVRIDDIGRIWISQAEGYGLATIEHATFEIGNCYVVACE